MKQLIAWCIGIAVIVVVVVVLAADERESPVTATGATAPIAPGGVPGRAVCATDRPGDGRAEAEEAREVQLPAHSGDPDAPPTSPRRALAEFMDAWSDRAWDRMARWTAPSWQAAVPGDEGRLLRQLYGTYRVRGWAIVGTSSKPSVTRFTVLVAYRDVRPAVVRERLRFVVNREDARGRLVTEGGRWGVFLTPQPDPDASCPSP